jgi:hypothetical protein
MIEMHVKSTLVARSCVGWLVACNGTDLPALLLLLLLLLLLDNPQVKRHMKVYMHEI